MADHTVHVDSGKYTFVKDGLTIRIDRHGEPWHVQQDAFNALQSIMCELDAARIVLAAARELERREEAPQALRDALKLHAELVHDLQPPSGWAA